MDIERMDDERGRRAATRRVWVSCVGVSLILAWTLTLGDGPKPELVANAEQHAD